MITRAHLARNGKRWSASRTLATALVLFAMLCGLTLVVARYPDLSARHAAKLQQAMTSIDRASNALEATNYGETRDHLRAARRSLEQIKEGR